tara:strand:- start:223 stop:639 length:417 start_codon:yes stop_codon:yes gene_type:complete
MKISVTGPNGGNVNVGLQAITSSAIRSFAKQLNISRLKTNILVKVHHKIDVGEWGTQGLCEPIDNRTFIIEVALYTNWLQNLAHEMVHVKQFALGEMDMGLSRWKSNNYCENIEYWDQPWEKEARRLEKKLVAEFNKD